MPLTIALYADQVALGEVVISATRERQLRSDVPLSIGVIGPDEIGRIQPEHPSDIMNSIPGVWVNQTTGEGHMTSIRQPLSIFPLFLYLENGIPTRSTGFFNHNALFEINIPQAGAIEVIRGPGTALYGSDAIGGVVNVETAAPPDAPRAEATVEGGSHGFKRVLLSGGASPGSHGVRADINVTDSEGWRNSTEYARQSATLTWTTQAGARTHVRSVAAFSRVDQKPAGVSALSEEDFRSRPTLNYQPISYRDIRALRISSAVTHERGRTLISATPFFRYNTNRLLPNWSLTFDPVTWDVSNWSIGMQLRARRTTDTADGLIVGGVDLDLSPGHRTETELDPVREGSIFVSATELDPLYEYDVTYRQASPYVHAEAEPIDGARFSAGLRLDLAGYSYDNQLSVATGGSHRRPPSTSVTFTHLSPKAGVTVDLAPHVSAFASYRHGFRVPEESQLFRQGSSENTVGLDPVKVDNVELGVRGRAGESIRFDAAVYRLMKADDIVRFVNADGTQAYVNAGRTSHIGAEVGLGVEPLPGLVVSGALTRARHRYEDWVTAAGEDLSGNEMELAPRTLANVSAEFEHGLLAGGSIALELNHVSPYWMDPANSSTYEGHDILALRAALDVTDHVRLFVRVTNLTDELYAERATFNAFRGDEFAPGLPRSVYVSLRYVLD
ncbi:MAG: TonB-dependent receptor [Rhodothermales bacterium]|nr:TonB-dependent receptor [Rhodothermales bacterium]